MSRPGPSRANRVTRRAADRTARGDTTVMRVPRHLTTGAVDPPDQPDQTEHEETE